MTQRARLFAVLAIVGVMAAWCGALWVILEGTGK